jgi:hypothetical protein
VLELRYRDLGVSALRLYADGPLSTVIELE